jgi:hypothetical protein
MQKIYLLLRSNKQTGPYSLEELVQLNLKPFDLVWAEGRSAAWQYPSEIPALKPYVPETPQVAVPFQPIATAAMEEKILPEQNPISQNTEIPKRVFVSVPKFNSATNVQNSFTEPKTYKPEEQTSFEKKEEMRTSTSYSQPGYHQQKPVEKEVTHTNYSRTLNDVEEDYTNWVYKQKTKKKASVNPKDLVLAALIVTVIGGGYYVMSKPSVANSVLPSNKTAIQTAPQQTENASGESKQNGTLTPNQKLVARTNKSQIRQVKNNKTKNPFSVSKNQTTSTVPPVQNSIPVGKTTTNIPTNNNDVASKEPEVKQESKTNAPTEKKKKLGDVIKGIFSKKEKTDQAKNDPVILEDPKPAENRQATRRDNNDNTSGSGQDNTAALADQIDISSNAPDNWMMGVKNLKVTLRNRSNTGIQTASVTVNYYDESNELLDRKTIYFNNVAPKSKATVTAPDHKFADHVDFKLVSVSAKEDRYARY